MNSDDIDYRNEVIDNIVKENSTVSRSFLG